MDERAETVPPTPAQPAYLIHTYEHRAYLLPDERPFRIGRDSGGDITVSEVFVSRQHAELRAEGVDYVIHPIGATPTFLNETQIDTPRILHEGDTITIGTMRFVYTRDRLPVAISVTEPVPVEERIRDTISDKRQTLTFPVQPMTPPEKRGIGFGVWVVVAIVILVIVIVVLQNMG